MRKVSDSYQEPEDQEQKVNLKRLAEEIDKKKTEV